MKIYYQPENLWKGRKAITRLRKATKLPLKQVKDWLAKQALWQVHMPPPKRIDYPHYYVTKVHQMHQADLLYLPHDKVYQNTYKYTLNVIDVASRYKASRPLKTKKASEVAEMFKDIYKKGPLKYPVELHVDNGTEFKADVLKLMKTHDVKVVSATTKYRHNFTAFVERFNKTLAERLFKAQDAQELQNPTKDSRIWVKYLQKAVSRLNSEKTQMLGMTPAKAVRLTSVELQVKSYPEEKVLPEDGLYRYLYQPGELEGGDRRRATDKIWSRNTFRLDRIVENLGQRVLYYLAPSGAAGDGGGPKRAFVHEELIQIPEGTEVPPEWVEEW